ncbi:MAG: hypothetical protein H7A37_10340 [Chlamydiales bacterium]|nr:hypothetical protein [Chlamydiia bacterium]MCP5508676.1 hypothetical protein [Chlamydiales bacterium]
MTQTAKTKYRIRNWKQYNRSLINRGTITFWFSNDVIDQWNSTERSGNREDHSSILTKLFFAL